jgi:hypothetical protein
MNDVSRGTASSSDAGGSRGREADDEGQPSSLTRVAREQARTQVEQGKTAIAQQLEAISEALDEGGRQFRENEQSGLAQYSSSSSEYIRRFAEKLEYTDLDQLIHEAENMARQRPMLFLGGAFAVGLLGARFFKSSSGGMRIGDSNGNGRSYSYANGSPNRGQPAVGEGAGIRGATGGQGHAASSERLAGSTARPASRSEERSSELGSR